MIRASNGDWKSAVAATIPALWFGLLLLGLLLVGRNGSAAEIISHTAETEHQNGRQEIRVLLPDDYAPARKHRVLYVLPVERGFESRYGYALGLLKELDVANRFGLIVIQPGFEKEPWYGDHATDAKVRQASYLVDYVVPFIEREYSTLSRPEGRLLLGFSKSGWGAMSLILRHPDVFGHAATWDAPLMFDRFHYGMEAVFGDRRQLDRFRPDLLAAQGPGDFRRKARLVVAGEESWGTSIPAPGGGSHTAEFHSLLDRHGLQHHYDAGVRSPHRWDKRWIEPTLEALIEQAAKR